LQPKSGLIDLKFLETFVWVARLRSFSLAAEKLCTTQAAVSNRIATLERDLGVRLFERDLRTCQPDAARPARFAAAEAIVRMSASSRAPSQTRTVCRGTVMIGAIDSIVYAWLPRLIERVKEAYPNVTIDLIRRYSINLARQIQDGQIDLGLIMGRWSPRHIRNSRCARSTASGSRRPRWR